MILLIFKIINGYKILSIQKNQTKINTQQKDINESVAFESGVNVDLKDSDFAYGNFQQKQANSYAFRLQEIQMKNQGKLLIVKI